MSQHALSTTGSKYFQVVQYLPVRGLVECMVRNELLGQVYNFFLRNVVLHLAFPRLLLIISVLIRQNKPTSEAFDRYDHDEVNSDVLL